jgi:hypothetical protein
VSGLPLAARSGAIGFGDAVACACACALPPTLLRKTATSISSSDGTNDPILLWHNEMLRTFGACAIALAVASPLLPAKPSCSDGLADAVEYAFVELAAMGAQRYVHLVMGTAERCAVTLQGISVVHVDVAAPRDFDAMAQQLMQRDYDFKKTAASLVVAAPPGIQSQVDALLRQVQKWFIVWMATFLAGLRWLPDVAT